MPAGRGSGLSTRPKSPIIASHRHEGAMSAAMSGSGKRRETLYSTTLSSRMASRRKPQLVGWIGQGSERSVACVDLAGSQDLNQTCDPAAGQGDDCAAVVVLAAGLLGWWFSRRGRAAEFESASAGAVDPLQEIRGEAEEVLRALDEESPVEPAAEETPEEKPATVSDEDTVVKFPAGEGDAELLDEESSDPEIQLDLARAYISMGDKEAARIILDEVISNGSEEQQAEARKMLDVLASP